jgi:tetratricopeptide (TPR) repeat protein
MTPYKYRAALILALATIIAYANTLRNGFVWDDGTVVTQNHSIRNSTYLDAAFTSELFHDNPTSIAYYRPLQIVSYMIDYFFWGLNPFGYHLTNLLLHLLCVLLVWSVAERIIQQRPPAFLVALFFAIHPVNTNAVAYVAGRADLLALAGMLASFLLFLHYRAMQQDARFVRTAVFAASILCYLLALFSRENALLLPLLILLYCLTLDRTEKGKLNHALAVTAPFAIIAAVFIAWRWLVLASCAKPWLSEGTMPGALRIQIFFRAVAAYAGMIIWPVQLQMDRQLTGGSGWLHVLTLAGVLILTVIVWMMFWGYRNSRAVFFGLCWFTITVLPLLLLNLVATVAEHWLYVPSIGFYLAFVAVCAQAIERTNTGIQHMVRHVVGFACVIVLAALTARTIFRNRDWATDASLYRSSGQVASQSLRVQVNLAHMHLVSGQLDQALIEFSELERRCQRGPLVLIVKGNLAAAYHLREDLERAIAKNEECLALDPGDVDARLRLAHIWEQRGDFVRAKRSYIAASAASTMLSPRLSLGVFLLHHDRLKEALHAVEEAYELEPGNADVFNLLAGIFARSGQIEKAREAFAMARSLDRHAGMGR